MMNVLPRISTYRMKWKRKLYFIQIAILSIRTEIDVIWGDDVVLFGPIFFGFIDTFYDPLNFKWSNA